MPSSATGVGPSTPKAANRKESFGLEVGGSNNKGQSSNIANQFIFSSPDYETLF